MKLLSWNCQGLGNPLTVQHFRALVAQERPDLVFIMETKNQNNVVERIRKRTPFKISFTIELVGITGGLVLMWDEEVHVEVEGGFRELINIRCKDLSCGDIMRISFLHAPTIFQERLRLWRQVKDSNYSNPLPWLCVGDFNEILYHWEKIGCREVDQYRMAAFRDFLDDCSLMDLESKGYAYTQMQRLLPYQQ